MTIPSAPQLWYAVQTHPHAESKAMQNLVRQGFEVYLPRYLKRRRHARRVDVVAAALFPRYLFVAMDHLTLRWRAIRSTIGVTDLVRQGDRPATVTDAIIHDLRTHEDEQGLIRLQRRPLFANGDKVVVVDGVFSTCFGLFEGMKDKDRVSILLELLGRKVRVLLDAESIAAA
jgi:transcriptional antiterminator RfaH